MRSTILLPLLLLGACFLDRSTSSGAEVVPAEFDRVVVDITAGDVQLFAGEVDQVRVEWAAEWGASKPTVDIDLEEDALVIRGDCPDLGLACHTDVYAVVPAEVLAEVEVFSGTATVDGLSGAVVRLTTGDVYLQDLGGAVEARVTEGHVEGTDLRATSVVASSGTGRVDLELGADFTHVDAHTTTGALSIQVPAGTYDLDLSSATGSVEALGVLPDPTSVARIQARTTTGALLVTGMGPSI